MSAQHTPGPWVVHPRDGIPAVGIDVGDGGELLPIVDVVHGRTKAEARRNRRLIAVSPKLLDALQLVVNNANGDASTGYFNVPVASISYARSVIAKAAGGAA